LADLTVIFAGLEIKNPIVASAGNITHLPRTIKKCIEAGVGAVCTKSISYDPDSWIRPRPANWFLDKYGSPGTLMTCETGFWPPDVAEKYIKEIKPLAEKENVQLIANLDLGLFESDELKNLGERMEQAGADMIEATCPCPIMMPRKEEVKAWYRENLSKVLQTLKEKVSIPVFPKLSSEFLIEENIRIIEDSGADAISFWAYLPGTAINVETGKPVMPTAELCYGKALRPLCSYMTSRVALKTKLPIMSSGGTSTWRDAVELLMCGATLVGVQTAVMYRGYGVLTEILRGLDEFIERKGIKSVVEIKGIATSHVEDAEEFTKFVEQKRVPKESIEMIVDTTKCNGCGRCTTCCYGAITIDENLAKIDLELCERCGVCVTICPSDAITIERIE